MREPSWILLMPVKRLDAAKSRLRGALDGVPHEKLALALARGEYPRRRSRSKA